MKETAYFELFGRISDRFVTEALIPAALTLPAPKRAFRETPVGRLLTSPAFFLAVAGTLAAAAVAVAIGLGITGQDKAPPAGIGTDTSTEAPAEESDEDTSREDGGTVSLPESETDEAWDKEHPYVARKNYRRGLAIIYGRDRFDENLAYLPQDMVFAGATTLNHDLHDRIMKTEEYLGVNIGFLPEENDEAVMSTAGKMSGSWSDDNYIFIASTDVIARMGGSGSVYMTAWDTLEAINTGANYWDTELLRTHTQGGHSYIACCSFIPPNAYAIAYNKTLYAAAAAQRDLYALVESGDWTVDTLMAILSETADVNGSISIHDLSGINAYLSAVGFRAMDTVEMDGGYTQSLNFSERQAALEPLYLKVRDLISHDRVNLVTFDGSEPPFIEQSGVLMDTRLTRDLAREAYGKPFGVLPLPKYDQAQSGYLSLHVNACMGLWCNQENKQMCGEVAELLAYFSRNSHEDYNRAVMGVYGKDDGAVRRDLAMLRIIHSTTHDVGLANSYLKEHFATPLMNGEPDTSFMHSSRVKNAVRVLRRVYGW